MKKIGIVGGLSPESTSLYYNHIMRKYYEIKHDHYFPVVIIYSLSFQKFVDANRRGKKYAINMIVDALNSLKNAGAEIAAISANTPHIYFDEIVKRSKVELVSIVDATLEKAIKSNLKKLLLLGTIFTMKSGMFENKFDEKGIEVIVPSDEEMEMVNKIIMNELAHGDVREESREKIKAIINKYDVDATILGCTELPMLFNENEIKILDTARIHAEKILEKAMEKGRDYSL